MWLLQESIRVAMQQAQPLSEAQTAQAMAAIGGPSGDADRVMVVSGDSATISVSGVMTSRPNFMAYYYGGGNTLYGDIVTAIHAAEADPAIKSVDFAFKSGGGEAQPVATVGDAIAAMKKPTRAIVTVAASAAYWLASQADKIVAVDRASMAGSLGAVQTLEKPSESRLIDVTSTNAPNKRPNPETDEGAAVIRAELDQFHDLFATAVAVGRDKSIETVNNTFGRGGMMLAEQALAAGMIDAIGVQTTTKTKITGATAMDLETLQASHPALYAQVLAQGHTNGAAAELDRVKFHGLMGQKTGATAFALAACLEGKGKDDTECMVEYMTFGRNGADIAARAADETQLNGNNPAPVDESARETAAISSIFERVGG